MGLNNIVNHSNLLKDDFLSQFLNAQKQQAEHVPLVHIWVVVF